MKQPLTLVGGEILEWSDLAPASGPPAMSGPVVLPVVKTLLSATDRVLVAGPHHLDLIRGIAGEVASVDVLVRSAEDASAISGIVASGQVFCGGLDRFVGEHYDLVIALDGVTRLFGPDSTDLSWWQSVTALRNLGQRLLLAVGNDLGLDSLIGAGGTGSPTDDEWPRTADIEPPAGLATITAELGTGPAYAVYPSALEPRLVVAAGLLTDHPGDTLLQATVGAGAEVAEAFTDPGRTMREVVGHGLGLQLAPAWWFLAGPEAEPTGIVAAEGEQLVIRLDRQGDGRWSRSVVDGTPGPVRDETRLAEIVVPAGRLLEDRLLRAARWDDQDTLLELATAYVEWLRSVEQPLFAVPDNVVVTGDRSFAVLDQSWRSSLDPAEDLIAVRALTRYAARQLAAGVRSPWPAGARPEQLVTRLAATAGITCDEALFEAAAKLDAEVAAEAGPRFAAVAATAAPQGLREATATINRLSAEIDDLRGQVDWLDVTVNRIRGSRAYRVGRMVLQPATKLRTLARRRPGKDA
jgi:hypothetical protein